MSCVAQERFNSTWAKHQHDSCRWFFLNPATFHTHLTNSNFKIGIESVFCEQTNSWFQSWTCCLIMSSRGKPCNNLYTQMQFVAGNGSITNQIPLATELSAYHPELTWAQNMLEVIDFHQGILHRNVVFRSCEYFQCIWNFILKCMYYEILMSAQAFLFLTSDSAAFRKAKLTCRHFSSSTSKYLIHHHPKAHIVAKCLPNTSNTSKNHQIHSSIYLSVQYTSILKLCHGTMPESGCCRSCCGCAWGTANLVLQASTGQLGGYFLEKSEIPSSWEECIWLFNVWWFAWKCPLFFSHLCIYCVCLLVFRYWSQCIIVRLNEGLILFKISQKSSNILNNPCL